MRHTKIIRGEADSQNIRRHLAEIFRRTRISLMREVRNGAAFRASARSRYEAGHAEGYINEAAFKSFYTRWRSIVNQRKS